MLNKTDNRYNRRVFYRVRLYCLPSAFLLTISVIFGLKALNNDRYSAASSALLNSFSFFLVALGLLFLLSPVIFSELDFFNSPAQRELQEPVISAADLDRVVRAFDASRRNYRTTFQRWFSNRRFKTHYSILHDGNPQVRYGGALIAFRQRRADLVIEAFLSERSSLVRRAIAKQIAAVWEEGIAEEVYRVWNEVIMIPEVAYIIERVARRDPFPEAKLLDLPKALLTLAVLSGLSLPYNSRLKSSGAQDSLILLLALADQQEQFWSSEAKVLILAFRSGLERVYTDESVEKAGLNKISERRVTEAIRELSPFHEGGLGTYNDLKNIDKIDQYYLFFCNLRFLMERDLLT